MAKANNTIRCFICPLFHKKKLNSCLTRYFFVYNKNYNSSLLKHLRRLLAMLLFNDTSLGVLMSKDEVQFVVIATLVRAKHDGVRSLVVELAEICSGVGTAG